MSVVTPTLLAEEFCRVRSQSLALCAPLTPEDMMVQSCPEASPAKWHLAHTTWFFETFILREFRPAYRPFHPDFLWLFNSYYNAVSAQPEKKLRASFSRPTAEEILAYRHHVDAAMEDFAAGNVPEAARERIVLGLNHEQQHQELLITDIKNAFWTDPLHPVYLPEGEPRVPASFPDKVGRFPGRRLRDRLSTAKNSASTTKPRATRSTSSPSAWPRARSPAPSICASWRTADIRDPSCGSPRAGRRSQAERWQAPLYWRPRDNGTWEVFTLGGLVDLDDLLATPVCHISYFEADAYARWAGKCLPTEAEWEVAAAAVPVTGNLLEGETFHPQAAPPASEQMEQLYGDVWEWTVSAYLPYPGFDPLPGALGEYNGKFMCNQMVLRGGSVATPASHIRATYRNFFAPATRWQFSGVRLADH